MLMKSVIWRNLFYLRASRHLSVIATVYSEQIAYILQLMFILFRNFLMARTGNVKFIVMKLILFCISTAIVFLINTL